MPEPLSDDLRRDTIGQSGRRQGMPQPVDTDGRKTEASGLGLEGAGVAVGGVGASDLVSEHQPEVVGPKFAGLETLLCVRDGGAETSSEGHPMIRSFDAVFPEEAPPS